MVVATWAAIVVLVVGSMAVFVWFLLDVRTLLSPRGPDPTPDAEDS